MMNNLIDAALVAANEAPAARGTTSAAPGSATPAPAALQYEFFWTRARSRRRFLGPDLRILPWARL